MLVYGDREELVRPAERLSELLAEFRRIGEMPAGMARHSALVSALIEAGRLEQGVSDAGFTARGYDHLDAPTAALADLTMVLAVAVTRSWRSGGADCGILPVEWRDVALSAAAELKQPEGFAFYAVYPEAFADAALQLDWQAPPRVIGIRSIGTSLGAIVAAALDAPRPVSVRPFGDPFNRHIALSPELEGDLLGRDWHFVIVDEGPGLSGSSFGAVADWLLARGVPLGRIAFVTSHAGPPGPQAQQRHRDTWSKVQRVVADLGPKLGAHVAKWAAVAGPLDEAPVEVSGGEWRGLLFDSEIERPAVNPVWERRKFLFRADGEQLIAKFAGLGREGPRKFAIARQLGGLVPHAIGFAHGFLIEHWYADAQPLRADEKPLEAIAEYLGARARNLDSGGTGASVSELLKMAKRNAGLVLGDRAEKKLSDWQPRAGTLQQRVVPMCIDGRLDRHEWLRLGDGRLLKADALDHHAGHDLIGCQDLAWDVAGAAIEFDLSEDETRWLAAESGRRAGRFVDPELLRFLTLAYLAFRLGHASLSIGMSPPADAERWRGRAGSYARRLETQLRDMEPNATRWNSAIGQQPERTGAGTNLFAPG